MTCKSCFCEFCWNCLGPYPNCHCKGEEEQEGKVTSEVFVRARDFDELNKRCANHAFSRDIAAKLKAKCEDELDSKLCVLLHEACGVLVEARQVLSHTCILQFHENWAQSNPLLSFSCAALEQHTEQVQESVEKIAAKTGDRLAQRQIKALRKRLDNFMQSVERGRQA